jgi:acetate kinase
VVDRFAQLRGVSPEALRRIICHLGNGCSVCAIEGGKSVDTSMGFTPLDGLVMGTRPGDLDAGVLLYVLKLFGMALENAEKILNEQSGLLALSGVSADMREITRAAEEGNSRCRTAIDVFCYRVAKYVGAYWTVLGGADALIFTGGIGTNAAKIRVEVCRRLGALGVELDAEANAAAAGVEKQISGASSRVAVWAIPTDEERVIARDTLRCIARS